MSAFIFSCELLYQTSTREREQKGHLANFQNKLLLDPFNLNDKLYMRKHQQHESFNVKNYAEMMSNYLIKIFFDDGLN